MATESRKQAILSGFEKVKIGMTTGEVEKLMTSPDFERIGRLSGVSGSMTTGRPPEMDIGKGRCWYEWAYYISKSDLNPASSNDVGIFLQFSPDGKLYWASPFNVRGLKQKGSPL